MVRGNQPDPRFSRGRGRGGQRGGYNNSNGGGPNRTGGNFFAPNQYQRQDGSDGAEYSTGVEYTDNTDWKSIAEKQRKMLEEMYADCESANATSTSETQATKPKEEVHESETSRGFKRSDGTSYAGESGEPPAKRATPLAINKRTSNHDDGHDGDAIQHA